MVKEKAVPRQYMRQVEYNRDKPQKFYLVTTRLYFKIFSLHLPVQISHKRVKKCSRIVKPVSFFLKRATVNREARTWTAVCNWKYCKNQYSSGGWVNHPTFCTPRHQGWYLTSTHRCLTFWKDIAYIYTQHVTKVIAIWNIDRAAKHHTRLHKAIN